MMTPAQMVRFFGDRSAASARNIIAAQASGNFAVAELNARQLFKNRLMVGLLTWRLGGNPRSAMEEAVAGFIAARQTLRQMDAAADVDHALPLPNALVVASLIDEHVEYSPAALARDEHDGYERPLDWLLVAAMRGPVDAAEVEAAVAELGARKRCKLAADTYRTYFEILGGAPQAELDGLVRAAESLYAKRARDSYYSPSPTDGGGPDNPHVVDYLLAAVLKKVGYQGESIHRWRW